MREKQTLDIDHELEKISQYQQIDVALRKVEATLITKRIHCGFFASLWLFLVNTMVVFNQRIIVLYDGSILDFLKLCMIILCIVLYLFEFKIVFQLVRKQEQLFNRMEVIYGRLS